MITPEVAGTAYAGALAHSSPELSGVILDYDDPRLPIPDEFKANREGNTEYTQFLK